MGQKKVNKGSKEDGDSITIKVTFDKEIWEIIEDTKELGKSSSGKINHICIAWLSEKGILDGLIKKRLNII